MLIKQICKFKAIEPVCQFCLGNISISFIKNGFIEKSNQEIVYKFSFDQLALITLLSSMATWQKRWYKTSFSFIKSTYVTLISFGGLSTLQGVKCMSLINQPCIVVLILLI